jgi:hypothetical protein
MSSLPESIQSIDLKLLREAPLKNEEIVELVAFISSAENTNAFTEHLQLLNERYDMTLEMRTLPIEVLSLREKFNLRSLYNFYSGLETEGYYSLIIPTITGYQDDKSAAVYADLLRQIFKPDLSGEFVNEILEFINTSEMNGTGIKALQLYFTNILHEVSDYAPIPDYIRDFDIDVNELPRLEEREISSDLPNEYIADYLLTQLNDYLVVDGIGELEGLTISQIQTGDDPDEARDYAKNVIIDRLERMNPLKRDEFVNLFKVDQEDVKDIRENRDIFRVYGPVNPYSDTDYSTLLNEEGNPDVNKIYGGARMFTDMQLEYDYEADLPMDDWFVGYCEQCGLKIRSYFHAIREPYLSGGWMGCYCSEDCLLQKIREEWEASPDYDPDTTPDQYNIYVIRVNLVRTFMNDINEYGIADRDYDLRRTEEDESESSAVIFGVPPSLPPAGLREE